MTLRFLLCVEAGRLEGEALLLCSSIRRFAGRLADSPISAYRPREGKPLADGTYAALADLGVELVEEPLNREHADFSLANKPYAAAHAEEHTDEDILAFLDSDSVILGEPAAFELADGIEAAAQPVGRTGDGSTGPGHPNDAYWLRLYELTGVSDPPWTTTTFDPERIRGYWNGGLFVARRAAGVMRDYLEAFSLLMRERHFPGAEDRSRRADLPGGGALAPFRGPETLPPPYNYRITRRRRYGEDAARLDLGELVHVHYMRAFHVEGFLEQVEPPVRRDTDQYRWLSERLPVEPRIVVPLAEGQRLTWRRIRHATSGELERPHFEAQEEPE